MFSSARMNENDNETELMIKRTTVFKEENQMIIVMPVGY